MTAMVRPYWGESAEGLAESFLLVAVEPGNETPEETAAYEALIAKGWTRGASYGDGVWMHPPANHSPIPERTT